MEGETYFEITLTGEEKEFIIYELATSMEYCDTDDDRAYYSKIIEKLST